MAGDGKFNVKLDLGPFEGGRLANFKESVTFEGLHGVSCFEKVVEVTCQTTPNTVCIDLPIDCSQEPRFMVIRPVSALFEKFKVKPTELTTEEWLEIEGLIPRDRLAKMLKFTVVEAQQVPKCNDAKQRPNTDYSLGRAQFYYDGLLQLLGLVGDSEKSVSKLHFTLEGELFLNEKGVVIAEKSADQQSDPDPRKKILKAVTVQCICGFGEKVAS